MNFELELRNFVLDGIRNNTPVENLIWKINYRKSNNNRSFLECSRAILYALLSSIPENIAPGKPLLVAFQKTLKQWQKLMLAFVQGYDMVDILKTLEEYLETDFPRYASIFQFLVHNLYESDIVNEESIFQWESERMALPEENRKFVSQCTKFLEWLKNAEKEEE